MTFPVKWIVYDRVFVRWVVTRVLTPTATYSVVTGLAIAWPPPMLTTRNWVVAGRLSRLNAKPPVAVVRAGLPTFWKPAVNGYGFPWRITSRLPAPVPDTVPSTVTAAPATAGLGTAVIPTERGIFADVKTLSAPSVVPPPLTATNR